MKALLQTFLGVTVLLLLSACVQPEPPVAGRPEQAPAVHAEAPADPSMDLQATEAVMPLMIVHKTPTCGCCGGWVEHMQAAGFTIDVRDADNIHPVKERVGVPLAKGSCHTAEIDGYFIEGHVPADDVKRLLSERPDAKGLVLPGMPAGSPGMEMPDGRTEPYTVELVHRDGSVEPFASH